MFDNFSILGIEFVVEKEIYPHRSTSFTRESTIILEAEYRMTNLTCKRRGRIMIIKDELDTHKLQKIHVGGQTKLKILTSCRSVVEDQHDILHMTCFHIAGVLNFLMKHLASDALLNLFDNDYIPIIS